MRANATSARLPAFSISSRQIRITSGLRRVSTPVTPMQKMNADSTRYQAMSIRWNQPSLRNVLRRTGAAREHDRGHGGDQQQDGHDLERDQELGQEQLSDLRRGAEAGGHVGALRIDRLQARPEDREA